MKIRAHDHGAGEQRERRRILRLLAGASLVPFFGCGKSDASSTSDEALSARDGGTTTESCVTTPEETNGPYPADGTNGPNALTSSGIVRSDIRTSSGTMTGTAPGIPLTIQLSLLDTSCAAISGHAVYVWQCNRDGNYSLYTVTTENYLRGIQTSDAGGKVTFTSIFPACYADRWPHIHVEVYPSVAQAAAGTGTLKTSQMAMPEDTCNEVYATPGYEQSAMNLAQITLASDVVFADGSALETPTVTGNVTDGYVVSLLVGIAI